MTTQLDQLCINTLRTLSIDAVQQAQSGHASMLLYSLLFLSGVKATSQSYDGDGLAVTLDDIKHFRQAG
ncbi:MAG TPA: hypothetical protein PKJ85_13975, partial [Nitrosomonas nitrosa]|nr:hypothetical protein [Nitrosomonas nitrosa]